VGSNVLAGVARQFNSLSLPRVGVRFGLTSLLLLAGAGSVHDAAALNETRTLAFHHTHSNEDLTVTFKRDGRYDEDALKELNHFLRDWRSQDQTTMDRHLFDILWEVYRDVDGKKPIQIISSYRSPATNAMLRRRSSGVARFSQHMLGHAMDFYIPDVPLEQIRYAGLRLQRGGVGFYPTSGSPFVHLDTGSIRHWPRMTREQLVKVFPDGRTVHVPSNGGPLKGYELARADIEKRDGDDKAMTKNSPSLWTRLFNKGKSNDEEDEGSAPAAPVGVMAAAAPAKPADAKSADAKSADSVPMPRSKPSAAATLQLASADAQIVQPAKPKQTASASAEKAEAKPENPADIINARGFWSDTPKQATAAQVAALNARHAVSPADPQSTASVSDALAYAPPANSPLDRSNIVAATAPIPRSVRPASVSRNSMAVTDVTSVVAKGSQGQGSVVSTSARIAVSKTTDTDIWMRVMILAPSATTAMSSTVIGDNDLTSMRAHFIKPQATIAMSFADDPQMGLLSDRFTGSATASLTTESFAMRTALLH
jgi:uncharacterized protein YcbK (DUF882 family)